VKRTITQAIIDEQVVNGGRWVELTFRADQERIPAILQLPKAAPRERVPAVLLLHGYSSRKEQMAESVGAALRRRGIASLAIDQPLHGARAEGDDARRTVDHFGLLRKWQIAEEEGVLALRYLQARPEIDGQRLAVVGYSLGAYLGLALAARDSAARAVVLAAGGDLPLTTPFTRLVRAIADPVRQVRRLSGRPLLMVNGRHDRTVTADQAERLFEAASEPKEIHWWDSGHYLPATAIDRAAEWLAIRLRSLGNVKSG
jgi:fermentation-respiration switch protein FrsA (DUF1100 family)